MDGHDNTPVHSFNGLVVEIEPAEGVSPSERHKAICRLYESRGKAPKRLDVV